MMEKGNGEIQRLLDNAQCPKCRTEFSNVSSHKFVCETCGLLMIMPEMENARKERLEEIVDSIKGWSYQKADDLSDYAHVCLHETFMCLEDLDEVCEKKDFTDTDDLEIIAVLRGILENEIQINFDPE